MFIVYRRKSVWVSSGVDNKENGPVKLFFEILKWKPL